MRRERKTGGAPLRSGELNRCFRCLAAATALAALWGCASTHPTGRSSEPAVVSAAPEVAVASTRFRKEYVLAPEDTLDIVVLRHPEISRTCVVRPDGRISVPMLDDVEAAGLTPQELDARLTDQLQARVLNPEVTVVVTEFRQPSVYVMGEVLRPGAVPLREAATALQAIARSGDFTSIAARDSVVLIRLNEEDELVAMRLRAEETPSYLTLSNTPLKADDILLVPKTSIGSLSSYLSQNVTPILGALQGGLGTVTGFKYIKLIDRQIEWLEEETDRIDGSTITPTFVNPNP
jgi:polysaccharide export outer membrane protein